MTSRLAALDLVRIDVPKLSEWLRRASAALFCRQPAAHRRLEALTALSPAEKTLLRRCLESDAGTAQVTTAEGAALSLEHAEVVAIYRTEPDASGAIFVVRLHPWARDRLRRYPEF